MLEMIQREPVRARHYFGLMSCDLEEGLHFLGREVNLAALTHRNGRGLPMKGTCGELREFKCCDCNLAFSKYFNHFEKPEGFRVVECYHCQGSAHLIQNDDGQKLGPTIAAAAYGS
jgi:hypothetical protein